MGRAALAVGVLVGTFLLAQSGRERAPTRPAPEEQPAVSASERMLDVELVELEPAPGSSGEVAPGVSAGNADGPPSEGPSGAGAGGEAPSEGLGGAGAALASSEWFGRGAPSAAASGGASSPRGRPASSAKATAPPSLTDPLTIDALRLPGPTPKPASSGGGRAGGPAQAHEARSPRASPAALYNDADNALVAGRGQECLALLDRADATPAAGASLREREQRAAAPVVRAQCMMALGRCDEGVARLRAAGWPDAAIGRAREKFCAP